MRSTENNIAVLGCGNLGVSIARGLVNSKLYKSNQITLTKRNIESIESFKQEGYIVTNSNQDAVKHSRIVVVCVTPSQLDDLLESIKNVITEQHIVISVVSGASIENIKSHLGNKEIPIVRAMPNTAIQHCQSMTCLAVRSSSQKPTNSPQDKAKDFALSVAQKIFNCLGMCIVLTEEQIVPATALCACGIAFFCRAIRAAAQGGCEIGFHAEDAIKIAAQTAKGAATLLLENKFHPEFEIDKVTTPQGCTISGLNQMEHNGFSSAMIKGIVTSAEKAASLYTAKQQKQQNQNNHQNQNQNNQQSNSVNEQQQVLEEQPVEQPKRLNEKRNSRNKKRQPKRDENQQVEQSQTQPIEQSESQSQQQQQQVEQSQPQSQQQSQQQQVEQSQSQQAESQTQTVEQSQSNEHGTENNTNSNNRYGKRGGYNGNRKNYNNRRNGDFNNKNNQNDQQAQQQNQDQSQQPENNNVNNENNNQVDEATQQQKRRFNNHRQQQTGDRKSFNGGYRKYRGNGGAYVEKNQTTTAVTEVEAN